MPKIIYVSHAGKRTMLDVRSGLTVMEGAVKDGVDGIDADCGGSCACATCHIYVDRAWSDKVGGISSEDEATLLEVAIGRQENSRLSCQIKITDELDGLIVHMPVSQR
jgi:ferredoxin, 2Fe-2S